MRKTQTYIFKTLCTTYTWSYRRERIKNITRIARSKSVHLYISTHHPWTEILSVYCQTFHRLPRYYITALVPGPLYVQTITFLHSIYKATHGLRFRLRSYHGECTGSRPLSEVKLRWAGVVLWWETTRERPVLQASLFSLSLLFFALLFIKNGFSRFVYVSTCLSLTQSPVVYICAQHGATVVKLNKPVSGFKYNIYSLRCEQETVCNTLKSLCIIP